MSATAIEKATIAEALYKNGSIPVKKIAEQLGFQKPHYIFIYGIEMFVLEKRLRRKPEDFYHHFQSQFD